MPCHVGMSPGVLLPPPYCTIAVVDIPLLLSVKPRSPPLESSVSAFSHSPSYRSGGSRLFLVVLLTSHRTPKRCTFSRPPSIISETSSLSAPDLPRYSPNERCFSFSPQRILRRAWDRAGSRALLKETNVTERART